MKDFIDLLPKPPSDKKGWPWTVSSSNKLYEGRKNWPKISIITPSYNQGQYIEETIRSVLLQNYPNLEYIIIDGGSSDNTLEIIKKYEKWISFWVSEPDNGQSEAINKGLRKSTGKIVNWLNSDDFYEKNAFYEIANAFSNPNIKVVSAESRVFNPSESWISKGSPINSDYTIFSKARIDQPATFFSNAVFDELGEIDSSLHLAMDLDLWVRFILNNGIKDIQKIDKVVVNFREHENSKTILNQEKMIVERFKILDEVEKSLIQKGLKFRYSSIHIENITRKREIIQGIQDFKMFWIKHFLKYSPSNAWFLSKKINPLLLKTRDLIDFIIIKSRLFISIK